MSAGKKFLRMMDPMNNAGGHHRLDGMIPKLITAFAVLFISLWFSNQTSVKLNAEINDLEKQRDMLKTRAKKIEVNMISMISGRKLTEVAEKRYGFKMPSSGQIIVVQKKNGFGPHMLLNVLNRVD